MESNSNLEENYAKSLTCNNRQLKCLQPSQQQIEVEVIKGSTNKGFIFKIK